MVKLLNCYLYANKSYGTLSKGAIFFWPTLYLSNNWPFFCVKTKLETHKSIIQNSQSLVQHAAFCDKLVHMITQHHNNQYWLHSHQRSICSVAKRAVTMILIVWTEINSNLYWLGWCALGKMFMTFIYVHCQLFITDSWFQFFLVLRHIKKIAW